MKKIMFVCHGNICRSPMAEFVCKDMLIKRNREGELFVRSAAVTAEEITGGIGNPVYPPVAALLKAKGINCSGKRAELLKSADGGEYDLFICMDDDNVRRARRIVGERNADKCVKLLSFCGESGDVYDPWYTRDFKTCYSQIERGVTALLAKLNLQ